MAKQQKSSVKEGLLDSELAKGKRIVERSDANQLPMLFSKKNYLFTALAAIIVVIGFILMSGTDNGNPYGTRQIVVAPIVVMVGFAIGFYAIFFSEKTID